MISKPEETESDPRPHAESVEIAVIGGGIAGAAACLHLRSLGAEPVWIARERAFADTPGEHLAPAARPMLARLGVHDLIDPPVHRSANTVFSSWGSERLGERNAILHLEGPATVLDRARFECALTERVLTAGVRRIDTAVSSVTRENGAWLIRGDDIALSAEFAIDASGRSAVLARDQATRLRADRLAALYAFLEPDPRSDVEPTRATLVEAVADGWWYAALLPDGRLALNFYTDPDLLPEGITRDPNGIANLLSRTLHVGRWVEEASFRACVPPRLASAGTTWIAPPAGTDWVAVGDASAAFDPLSSHGMTTALWTGIMAAEAVVVRRDDHRALERYAGSVVEGVRAFLSARTRVYASEQRFAYAPFWHRRRHRGVCEPGGIGYQESSEAPNEDTRK